MQYALVLAAAALAQAHEHHHGRLHARDVKTVVNVDVVTVTEYVTAGSTASADADAKYRQHQHSWSAASSWTQASSAPASSVASSVSSAAASSSSSAEASPTQYSSAATTFATSSSSPAAYSSYSASSPYSSASSIASYSSATSASSSAVASSTGSITSSNLTPNGKKAGLSGYVGIQGMSAFSEFAPYISWYSDYTANTADAQGVVGVGMLWGGDGSVCSDVTPDRLATFNSMMSNDTVPDIMFGFYEPDCTCDMSSDMSVSDAQTAWDSLLAPLGKKGTVLGSPSMCKQKDEDFLTPFADNGARSWDVTSIHINKPNITGVKEDVEYYTSTYGKPIWVSEFACVDDSPSWVPCTDQDQINSFINDAVSYFESNDNVVAYGPSNGAGLGDVWPLTDSSGALTASGQTYLSAIKSL